MYTGSAISQLRRAIDDKNLGLVKILLQKVTKAQLKNTTFSEPIYDFGQDMTDAIALLSEDQWITTKINVLHIAAIYGYTSIVRAILNAYPRLIDSKTDDVAKFTALQFAIINKNRKTVDYLIEKGASLKGALLAAVASSSRYQQSTLIETLLRKGADVNEKSVFNGTTPLFHATSESTARLLISRGANVNHKDTYGWTPLMFRVGMFSSYAGHENRNEAKKIVDLLVSNNTSLTAKGRNRNLREVERGISLIHLASLKASIADRSMFDKIVRLYTDNGMDLNPRTSLRNTPPLFYLKTELAGISSGRYISYIQSETMVDVLKYMDSKGMNLKLKDASNVTVRDLLRRFVENRNRNIRENVERVFRNFINSEQATRQTKMKNLYIPGNLNTLDPILFNHVNKNNAYIIRPDLVNKNITNRGKTKRVREVKTVYNKSSLNGMIQAGRTLVSPVTRRPFTHRDVLKLTDVAPAAQLKKYKKNTNGAGPSS